MFLTGAETRQGFNAHWPVGKAIAEILQVLLGQQGSRCQQRDLLVGLNRHEGSAHSYFRFTKADIPTHQHIHRLVIAHTLQHVFD